MLNTLLLGEYISSTTSFSLISQGLSNHVLVCLCRLYVFLCVFFVSFQLYTFFFIINTVFVLLMYMYACSSVYMFFVMLFYLYCVCVFYFSIFQCTYCLHLTCLFLLACLWCTCMFIIVINLRFGVHTFLPQKVNCWWNPQLVLLKTDFFTLLSILHNVSESHSNRTILYQKCLL